MTIAERFDALTENERDALWRAYNEHPTGASTVDVAFDLAFPNARAHADCFRARGILHRLERLGALRRIVPMRTHFGRGRFTAPAWILASEWVPELQKRDLKRPLSDPNDD